MTDVEEYDQPHAGKLEITYSVKINECLKENLAKLNEVERKQLTKQVQQLLARAVHNSESVFRPSLYGAPD